MAPKPWNASYMLANGFLTACGIVGVDFVWLRMSPKLANEHEFRSTDAVDILKGYTWERPKSGPWFSLKERVHCEPSVFAQCDIIFSWPCERVEDWVLDLGAHSPAQPRVRVHGKCLSLWLVEFARARTVMIDDNLHFWIIWLPVFGVN